MKKSLVIAMALVMAAGVVACGAKEDTTIIGGADGPTSIFVSTKTDAYTDEQVVTAIENYCYAQNPDLKEIVETGEYPVYWEVQSSDANEIVVLYRSYTGALIRYYVNPTSGDTYVTEFVPGITEEEEKNGETFNVKDYMD